MQESDVRDLIKHAWQIDAGAIALLGGGMNSHTWEVRSRGTRWALKMVPPHGRPGFKAGLFAATAMEAAGLPAGAPVPTRDGRVMVELPHGTAALLTWVEGVPLSASPETVEQIGRLLATAHSILRTVAIPDAPPFDWVDPEAPHLEVEPWVRPAVSDVVREWQVARASVPSWGFLHADPAPQGVPAHEATDRYGIIDWASGVHGPLLFDLASAAMYVGDDLTPGLVEAYATHGGLSRLEVEQGLPTLQRYRYAVQADYFARRVYDNEFTGIVDSAENSKGLDDARDMLGA